MVSLGPVASCRSCLHCRVHLCPDSTRYALECLSPRRRFWATHVCACLRTVGRRARRDAMGRHRPYKERKFTVGQRLLTLRTRAKLTQTDLAALVGVNRRSLQNWESGAGYPKEDALQRLIAVFLAQGVFTPGHEQEEAAQLWELVSQDAPRPLTPLDAAWFTSLLAARPVPVAAATAPVASTDALPFAL